MTDVLALVMRLCVQLLFKREATMPSSLNTQKMHMAKSVADPMSELATCYSKGSAAHQSPSSSRSSCVTYP